MELKLRLRRFASDILLFLLFAFLSMLTVAFYKKFNETATLIQGDYSSYLGNRSTDVILYSAKSCPVFKYTKSYLTRNKFTYEEREIEVNEAWRSHLRSLNSDSVPTIIVGDKMLIGYDEELLMSLLSPETQAPL